MYQSNDEKLSVEVISDVRYAIFPAADVAILPLPNNALETSVCTSMLYQSPADRQILLLLPRSKRQNKLQCFAQAGSVCSGWKFMDSISLVYNCSGSRKGNCLVPLCETGFLFSKGSQPPNLQNTSWFRDGSANASNLWDLGITHGESNPHTYVEKFSGELCHILMSLAKPLQYGKIIYGMGDWDNSMMRWIQANDILMHCYVHSNEDAQKMITCYNSLLS